MAKAHKLKEAKAVRVITVPFCSLRVVPLATPDKAQKHF